MNSNRKAFRQLATMILLTILTQMVSLVKLSVTASNFGATVEMDAFNFSFNIGTFIFSFIGTGVTTVLIPAIINKKNEKTINNFISILYGVSLIFILVVWLGRRCIISAFSSGSVQFIEIASNVMLITLISQFFNTILGVTNAVFQCNDKFNIPKIITLVTTILLTVLVMANRDLTVFDYANYILITMILNVVLQCYIIYKDGFRYKIHIDFADEELKSMLKVFVPTMFSTGLYQISLLTDSMISSGLGEGQISILNYSNNIMSIINTMLISNIMVYIYPRVSRNINNSENAKVLFDYLIFFNGIICLLVIGFISIGKPVIGLLYEGGKFTSIITEKVYICSYIYMLGLPINVMRDLIYRYFYAKGNTKATFYNSISASIVNIVVSIILANFMGLYGIVIGTVITSVFSFISIIIRMKKVYEININKKEIILENLKIVICSILVVAIISSIKNILEINNVVIYILIYGTISVILYAFILWILKSKVYRVKL